MIELPNYEDLPIVTDAKSAEWASRLAMAIAGDASESPRFDLDLVERMVQAIRNETTREVCIDVERFISLNCWREP